jgi:TAT (twin-arginine translocation) pathway-exported protein
MSTEKPSKNLNRRQFLKTSAGLAVAAGCFSSIGLRQAIAEARRTGKPVLTPARVESNIPAPTSPEFHQHIAACKENPRAYLEQTFHLTRAQQRAIDSLSPDDRQKLNAALDTAEQRKLPIRIQHVPSPQRFSVQPQVQQDSVVIKTVGHNDCPNQGPAGKVGNTQRQ